MQVVLAELSHMGWAYTLLPFALLSFLSAALPTFWHLSSLVSSANLPAVYSVR